MIRVNTKDAMKLAGLTPDIPAALGALATLKAGTGRGNDFIGWLNLPTDYDKAMKYMQYEESRRELTEAEQYLRKMIQGE